jgi:cell division protein FtsB
MHIFASVRGAGGAEVCCRLQRKLRAKEDTSAVTVQERTDLETADRAVIRLFTAEYS